jgi:hypothetical protein
MFHFEKLLAASVITLLLIFVEIVILEWIFMKY